MLARPQRTRSSPALGALLALAIWLALAGGASAFEVSDRVRVVSTGQSGTVAVLPDEQHVVVAFDGHGAAVRSYRPGDLEPASAPPPAPEEPPAGWNGYGVGSWPPASWRPYADSSPFNTPVGDVTAHPRSAEIVAKILSLGSVGNLAAGPGITDTFRDYSHPTFWAQPTDPLVTLEWTGGGPGAAIDGHRIRIPTAARAAGGGDGHMTVVQPDGWEYDFWRARPGSGGLLSFSGGGRTRIDGHGLDSGATAANFGNLAGIIRAQELAAGRIDHALFVVVRCLARNTSFGYGTRSTSNSSYVYPASHQGSACSTDSTDLPPMGARLKLAMTDTQINALAVPAWKKTILRALATYGAYIGDTGGPGFDLMLESGTTYTAFGRTDPLVTYASSNGVTFWENHYVFDVGSNVDWARYLRVLPPPTP